MPALLSTVFAALLSQAVVPGAVQQAARVKKPPAKAAPAPAPQPRLCDGDYADVIQNEKAEAPREPFVFAVRNTATYEHVYYGREGKLRRSYLRSVVHGTGFAFKVVNGETQLVTNEHVAEQPDVTDDDHPVDGVPMGSKKVREQLKIVRDENDDYEPGHTPLVKLLADPQADIAVLKARKVLGVLPFRVGRSGALRPGNVVQVRGFPLGAFAALNVGKVLNPMTVDSEKGWNHADFVVDALLNSGNSGSPVFAISCVTGEPELVGVYHAGYTEGTALNAVVAIDQLKEEFDTLHVPKRDATAHSDVTAQDRDKLVKQLFTEPTHSVTFPFGGRSVVLTLIDPQLLRFSVLEDDFPMSVREAMGLLDHGQNGFGTLDAVAVPVDGVVTEAQVGQLEQDIRDHFERLYDSLWKQVLGVIDYRGRLEKGRVNADAFADAQGMRSRLRKRLSEQKEILNMCAFEADRANFGAIRSAQAGPPPAAPAPALQPSGPDAAVLGVVPVH